ncbi:FdhF/YdeP family oxidoreductase [Halpernia frigidisoli]|uniref:Oxidoreductase alpha (Molybdopterin) subunit n=1 Tax=Halpernia frigidisoli TaxID=1125876 RepID=A0A1I3FRU0_9FLAO|nr:FdhF/YdeP family oxidoreductase [Halpernia frigidisoli]SFI13930.1 oxidoreductase alpha (molybdopterin) subunit [Halpernia frigidisoli]
MSENKSHHNPNAENPATFTDLKLSEPETYAAGKEAVLVSAEHILKAMNPVRGFKALNQLNAYDGFDCPSCAWPDPDDDRSAVAEYCENGAKAISEEATTKVIWEDFFALHSVEQLSKLDDYHIGKSGRIGRPMYLPENGTHYEPISWENAFKIIAEKLNGLNSPDEAIFYNSGRTSNEAAFLYQLFIREFGTNNMADCNNLCHRSSAIALEDTVGIGKGSTTLQDLYEAEAIIIIGQNPGTNHPRMLSALKKARENDALIIAVNPLKEAGLQNFTDPQSIAGILGREVTISNYYLQIRVNGDMALMQAIAKFWFQFEDENPGQVLDQKFITEETAGFEAFKKHIIEQDLDILSKKCGIPLDKIKEIAEKLKFKNKIVICWAMGLTQHKNSINTIKEAVNLLLMKGSIGKPGAGTFPVRGHSNVQGNTTMGINEKTEDWLLENIEKVYGFVPPKKDGFDAVDSITAMHKGDGKIFFGLGGNFLSATSDTKYTAKALQNCELTVHVSTKLNRSHLVTGKEALILPTYGRSDIVLENGKPQFISTENSTGVIQNSKGNLEPVSKQLLSETAIVCQMALEVLGDKTKVNWKSYNENYDLIRDDIEKVIPGFDNYNERVRLKAGFYLPNAAREGKFNTENSKANFSVSVADTLEVKENELIMITIRSHDQFNTTIYGMNDRYRGIKDERRVIFMNEKDMAKRGLKKLDVVDLFNYYGNVERVARKFLVIPYSIPEECCATYFPETNVLVPINSVGDGSNTPTSKSVIIEVKKSVD